MSCKLIFNKDYIIIKNDEFRDWLQDEFFYICVMILFSVYLKLLKKILFFTEDPLICSFDSNRIPNGIPILQEIRLYA
jgi:hypothetical protein